MIRQDRPLFYMILGFNIVVSLPMGMPLVKSALKTFIWVFTAFLYPRLNKFDLFKTLMGSNVITFLITIVRYNMVGLFWTGPDEALIALQPSMSFMSHQQFQNMFYFAKISATTIGSIIAFTVIPLFELVVVWFMSRTIIPKYFNHISHLRGVPC